MTLDQSKKVYYDRLEQAKIMYEPRYRIIPSQDRTNPREIVSWYVIVPSFRT